MSRETYQLPSSVSGGAGTPGYGGASGAGGAGGAGAVGARTAIGGDEGVPMNYICGDCGTKFPLKRNEAIRCRECGCRVLYKVRTNSGSGRRERDGGETTEMQQRKNRPVANVDAVVPVIQDGSV